MPDNEPKQVPRHLKPPVHPGSTNEVPARASGPRPKIDPVAPNATFGSLRARTLSVESSAREDDPLTVPGATMFEGKLGGWSWYRSPEGTNLAGVGAHSEAGRLELNDRAGATIAAIGLDAESGTAWLGNPGIADGQVVCLGKSGSWGAIKADADPQLTLSNNAGAWAHVESATNPTIGIGNATGSRAEVKIGHHSNPTLALTHSNEGMANLVVGESSILALQDPEGASATIQAGKLPNLSLRKMTGGSAVLTAGEEPELRLASQAGTMVDLSAGPDVARLVLGGPQRAGRIEVRDVEGRPRVMIEGGQGDIILKNADCAEEFDILDLDVEAGTVMVLDDEPGRLRVCRTAYDGRVAGVVSGAGAYRPGLVLDGFGGEGRRPVALMGKVYCRVEAESAPIRIGSLLTTSALSGHAMAVTDRDRAFGAVLGKALQPFGSGVGLIPVLVALQ